MKYDDNGPVYPTTQQRPPRVTRQPTSQIDRLARLVPSGPERDALLADVFYAVYNDMSDSEQMEIDHLLNNTFRKIRGMGDKTSAALFVLLAGIEVES